MSKAVLLAFFAVFFYGLGIFCGYVAWTTERTGDTPRALGLACMALFIVGIFCSDAAVDAAPDSDGKR